ncbi:MAG: tetraacyldisaccharide 4'-kinase [Syntrophobacteraceae bacterium]
MRRFLSGLSLLKTEYSPGKLYRVILGHVLGNWYGPAENMLKDPLMRLLKTFSRFYETGLQEQQARLRMKQTRLPAFVLSIGNLAVGGTGKTPLAIWICKWLLEEGLRPAVLSRGYGRKDSNPARVPSLGDPDVLSRLFGDEPALMAGEMPAAPVWVGRRRAVTGNAALRAGGVDTLVLDDGFQHLALARDLDIVLLDSRNPFGNGFLLPAGPLREPVLNLVRADACVLTHADSDKIARKLKSRIGELFPGKPVFACRHIISGFRIDGSNLSLPLPILKGCRAVAFAGLARPEGFFLDLEEAGVTVCMSLPFPDHYRYSASDFQRIFAGASEQGAQIIITTAKDAVRISSAYRNSMLIAEMRIEFGRDHERFCAFLSGRLGVSARNAR